MRLASNPFMGELGFLAAVASSSKALGSLSRIHVMLTTQSKHVSPHERNSARTWLLKLAFVKEARAPIAVASQHRVAISNRVFEHLVQLLYFLTARHLPKGNTLQGFFLFIIQPNQ